MADMSIISMSNLSLWLKALCFLSLARHSTCSPVDVLSDSSLGDSAEVAPIFATRGTSPVNIRATNLGAPVANCATLPNYAEWFQPSQKFDNGDCQKALELFYNDYTRDHEGIKYEFLASGVAPVHGIPTQRVPLKRGFGTCYIVVAMRNMFVEGELPGETPTPSAGSDISDFTQLYQYAQDIYGACSNPEVNQPGWHPAGDLNSIAVFIWQSVSDINKRIRTTSRSDLDLISTPGLRLTGGPVRDTA